MQLYADRQALHQIPELCWDLPQTRAYIRQALSALSCQVFEPVEGAICAWFDFGREAAIAFRADMDALPIEERSGSPYASRHPGKMHACGHDGHMAILLELARRLSEKKSLPHNVLLVFQPGEESPGGAKPICDTGVFAQYNVTAIFGLHLWPGLEPGQVFSRVPEMMARASEVTVDIYGKSSHIAKASAGIDATQAAAEFYTRVRSFEQSLSESTYRLLNFGIFHSGTARNALSAHAHLEGSLRAFQDEVFETLETNLRAIGAEVAAKYGCRLDIHLSEGYPAVLNPQDLWDRVSACAPLKVLEEPCMTAEDFAWYQKFVPGMFFFLGLGDTPALHADTFDFDETILTKGADFFEVLAEHFK